MTKVFALETWLGGEIDSVFGGNSISESFQA